MEGVTDENEVKKVPPKDLVQLLMTPSGEEARVIRARDGSSVRRTFLVYSCPRQEQCTEKGLFCFEKGTGFTNPYNHLKTCISGGDESHLSSVHFATFEDVVVGEKFSIQNCL